MAARMPAAKEGSWYSIPLAGGGYAAGLVARARPGGDLLCYFFGPLLAHPHELAECVKNAANDSTLVRWVGRHGISTGKWPLIGAMPEFSEDVWPVPALGKIDPIDETMAWEIRTSPRGVEISRRRIDAATAKLLPPFAFFPHGAIGRLLEMRLRAH